NGRWKLFRRLSLPDASSDIPFQPIVACFAWGRKPIMTATASAEVMAELDGVINDRSPARRVEILRQVASLFLSYADRLDAAQIDVFDDVLVRLMERAEPRALAQLSGELSGLALAPKDAIRKLAF